MKKNESENLFSHLHWSHMSGVGLSFSLQIIDTEPVLLGLLSAEKTIGM